MTLMETAQLLGNFGEFIGAIAVVLTLIYLAIQVRHSKESIDANTRSLDVQNRSTRIEALTAVGDGFSRFRSGIREHPDVASIWVRGGADLNTLDAEERVRLDMLLVDMFWAWSMMWLYEQEQGIDKSLADLSMQNLTLYAQPGIKKWWFTSGHRSEYPAPFSELVDKVLEAHPP